LKNIGGPANGYESAKEKYYSYAATNIDIVDNQETNDSWDVKGNYNIF
jgi:hypothetical protein